jgi:hypothetical protein
MKRKKRRNWLADLVAVVAVSAATLYGMARIHGKDATIGCIPIGDDAIEDVFYLVSAVGLENVGVVIAPYDMRKGRVAELEQSKLPWYPELCGEIADALR